MLTRRRVLASIALLLAVGVSSVACGGDGAAPAETSVAAVSSTTAPDATRPDPDRPLGFQWFALTKEAAIVQAEASGTEWRLAREDDRSFPLTEDFVVGRVTFSVDGGRVTSAVTEVRAGIEREGAEDVFDLAYVGMDQGAALARAEGEGRAARLIRVDDEYLEVTADHVEDRMNFEVDAGVVTAVSRG